MLKDTIVPTVLTAAKDPIPNIRFNVAKSLEQVVPVAKKFQLTAIVNDQIKPALLKLTEDGDMDVRFYGQRALSVV